MRLAATRSSISLPSMGPPDGGAGWASARVTTSAVIAPPRNARRPSAVACTAQSLPPARQRRAEIIERAEEGGERRRHRLVAAADEADLPDQRRLEPHGGEPPGRDVALHRELGGDRQPEPRLDELLHRLRVAELHRRARGHPRPREPRVDLAPP